MRINIAPLSINKVFTGRRFKTDLYREYCRAVSFMLPPKQLPAPPFQVNITWGMSNNLSDVDNPAKPFIDILQAKYKFNDRDIKTLVLSKELVEKGKEYIDFEIKNINN